jgi:Family of unknown function (DUF6088)
MAHKQVIDRIRGHGRGWVFTPRKFRGLGTRQAVGVALGRLLKQGTIERISHGLYYYPKRHPVIGRLAPSPEAIAKALTDRAAARIQPSGAYAANILGLSEQVPAKIVFFTDDRSKSVRVGKQTIQLKHTAPKNMAAAGRVSGVVAQALAYLGRKNVNQRHIEHLKRTLTAERKREIARYAMYVAEWMRPYMQKIADEGTM